MEKALIYLKARKKVVSDILQKANPSELKEYENELQELNAAIEEIEATKEEAMKNFFDAYSYDVEGSLHNMSQEKLLDYLDSDIFIGCTSAATGIPEQDFVKYSLEYFGFVSKK